jgi:hypothetical protein
MHPDTDGQVIDAHGNVVDQSSFGIQFRYPIQSCGLPVRQNPARLGRIDRSVGRSPCARQSDRPKHHRINRDRVWSDRREQDRGGRVRVWTQYGGNSAIAGSAHRLSQAGRPAAFTDR